MPTSIFREIVLSINEEGINDNIKVERYNFNLSTILLWYFLDQLFLFYKERQVLF